MPKTSAATTANYNRSSVNGVQTRPQTTSTDAEVIAEREHCDEHCECQRQAISVLLKAEYTAPVLPNPVLVEGTCVHNFINTFFGFTKTWLFQPPARELRRVLIGSLPKFLADRDATFSATRVSSKRGWLEKQTLEKP